ncbi:MAG: GSCFA domain-containing protein [Bacteroidales bacterium]|nr:GSCFA domain-containing protein [Bacteroidales bacterium]
MHDFITPVQIPHFPFQIDYSSRVLFMGSCFAGNIGRRMEELKFQVCHNPFGVVYNPRSVSHNLFQLLQKDAFTEQDLSFHNELWFSYSHYTLFSDPDKRECLNKINRQFKEAKAFLAQADLLSITLGTSWAYSLKETGEVVSNCHKVPAPAFNRTFLSAGSSAELLEDAILALRKVNPGLKILLTVSPIRHWKDGAIENQRSKAALILAIAELQKKLDEVYYFPAYEIFMDELRDYRFYAADMLHPSEEATAYIWHKFSENLMDNETLTLVRSVERIIQSVKHKPRFPHTEAYSKFITKTLETISIVEKEYPFMNFEDEKASLKKV